MSEQNFVLNATLRTADGSAAARRVRRQNQTPAVVYGDKKDTVNVTLCNQELKKLIAMPGALSKVLTLSIDGKAEQVMIKDMTMAAVGVKFVHLDLLRVSKSTQVQVKVAIHFTGEQEAEAIKIGGGTLAIAQQEIEVSCLPSQIPEALMMDIQNLGLGETIFADSLVLPKGVTLVHADQVIPLATMNKPRGGSKADTTEATTEEASQEKTDA